LPGENRTRTLAAWVLTALTGLGVARFDTVNLGPGTDPAILLA